MRLVKYAWICAVKLVLAADASSFACGVTNTTSSMALISGEATTLCVHLLPQRVKIAFNVQVDQFVALTARHIYEPLTADTDVVFQLSSNVTLGGQSAYLRPSAQRVYPIFNLLISLTEGNVTKIEVEDISAACTNTTGDPLINAGLGDAGATSPKNCPVTPCTPADNAVGKCDFKVLVAWIGTDRQGTELISAAERISNYKNYNLPALFAKLLALNNNLDSANPEAYQPSLIPTSVASRLGLAR